MTNKDFLNPEFEIAYINDSVLWGDIFKKPFPKDLNDQRKGDVMLSAYFYNKICLHESRYNQDIRGIIAKKKFHSSSREEKGMALRALCGFLKKFNKPHIDCLLYIPNHVDIPKRPEFSPMSLYYDYPTHLVIDEEKDMIRVYLESETYARVHHYSFNECIATPKNSQSILLSFSCFLGFGLPV